MFAGYRGRKIEFVSPHLIHDSTTKYVRIEGELSRLPHQVLKEQYEVLNGAIVPKAKNPELEKCKSWRVAIVSSYGSNCGMSTYCKYLVDEMQKLVSEVRIFAEIDPSLPEQPNVVRCWDRVNGVYTDIIGEVKKYNPDIVYIQHEYGSFSNPAQWNLLVGHLSHLFRTVVVLHSVYDHVSKLVFEAPCKEIVVHSKTARDLLHQKGVDHATIHHIPHGCVSQKYTKPTYSLMNDKHVIFQYGFGFEYKGWSNIGEIINRVKQDFSEVTYIGIFNTSKFCLAMHNAYYDKLMKDIADKGLDNNIVLHKGFRSEEILFSYMQQSKVNLFPYWNHHDWLVHGASGAVRLALASGTPTIVGNVPFFYEFKGYIPVCDNIDEYVECIKKIFTDAEYVEHLKKRMLDFIEERSWDNVASWLLSVKPNEEFTAPIPTSTT